ncbi:hypothetical protein [Achromobacter arsenitoxydans]|uniref:Transmembrane protein n=1 Tax=Achromobacter arsenitoxydans SY8 TaxID=477184 RepID=H0F3B6_9BURK|nr:hypothetical protein [Achromobacter arsenitoxydans]EHK67170.1 hypothetical protein KYC_06280 [Achromobacter arsenitoxydans SY8]
MARVLKKGLLVLALFAVVWLAVIIWWQESRTLPTGVDIGLYLFALPLALLAAFWAGSRLLRAARAPKAAPAPAQTEALAEAPPRPVELHLIAVAARAGAGADAAAIAEALAEQKRPELDAELKTPQGFPIFAARVPGVDDMALYSVAREQGAPPDALAAGTLRVTALLADIARALTHDAHARATEQDVPAREEDWPRLRFDVLIPADWSEAARQRALAAVRAAAGVWPDARIGVAEHLARDAMAADLLLRQLAAEPQDAKAEPQWRIVLAGDGYIDPEQVAQWDGLSTLLTHANPQGRVPGEAAAGLLLAPPDTEAGVRITLSPVIQRQKSADARGAQAEAPLADLARNLLETAGVAPDGVAHIVSDADHRGSRPLEPLIVASQLFAHLDAGKDCQAVGVACGHTGAAASLLTLAVASETCMQIDQPVLTLTLQDPALRSAALVSRPAASVAA